MPTSSIVTSPMAAIRVAHATRWLAAQRRDQEVLVVAATHEAAAEIVRAAGAPSFGWHKATLGRLAGGLAAEALARAGLTPVGALPLQALCARIADTLAQRGALGRFAAVSDRPGLPRALARTVAELRMAGIAPDDVADRDVAVVLREYEAELGRARFADRAVVLRMAAARALECPPRPLLLLDVPLSSTLEQGLVAALAGRADALATVPAGDTVALAHARAALGDSVVHEAGGESHLARLQRGLFADDATDATTGGPGGDVILLSAPGETRECVEIARMIVREAERGVPFDRMAVLLRGPAQYRAHLEEALRRAAIPAHFARGTVRPDPAGRAFAALLACAADGLSARRFAEYLSLGEVPDATDEGLPPPPPPAAERYVPPDEELVPGLTTAPAPDAAAPAPLDPARPVAGGTLRAPQRWEQVLVDAAVIGGKDRWVRRLSGFERERRLDIAALDAKEPGSPQALRFQRQLDDLAALRAYALPLLEALETLSTPRAWGAWLDDLSALASRALRHPERVHALLAELAPMAEVGPVDLTEVRLVLEPRLTELTNPAPARRHGSVYIASTAEARGLVFDVVFIPGVAEKLFPQKVVQDPVLGDEQRAELPPGLLTDAERALAERLALRLAVGAARAKVVVSYPRLDVEAARPRTPSFYALEVLRAAEGRLPGFDELARRAESASGARIGWPAPAAPEQAIDEAEHDLALLERLFREDENRNVGTARYLLQANEHLARALRFRARRWKKGNFTCADGLVNPAPQAKAALARHALSERSFSPTALQNFAACPYRFFLYAVHKLGPREEPQRIEELDPLQRGSLVHEVTFELLGELHREGALPVTEENLEGARGRLDEIVNRVADRFADDLAPAIDRVYRDGIDSIKADLREWLRRMAVEDVGWTPAHFELSFGLVDRRAQDPHSREEDVSLDCGIRLRGSIDLVELRSDGALRATDYKTGKQRAKKDQTLIGGGEVLQPVFYALTLEKVFPGRPVRGGRLYYCTSAGGFEKVDIDLTDEARGAAVLVAKAIREAIEVGMLPAAPKAGACEYCDYQVVCGPYEELRTSTVKRAARLPLLQELRSHR